MNKLYRLLLLSLVLALLVSACGGNKDSDDTDSTAKATEATVPLEPVSEPDIAQVTKPPVEPEPNQPGEEIEESPSSADANRVFKLDALNTKLREFSSDELQSYRLHTHWEMTSKQDSDASVQTTDIEIAHTSDPLAEQMDISISFGGQASTSSIMHIGDKLWMQAGDMWTEASSEDNIATYDQVFDTYDQIFDSLDSAIGGLAGDAQLVGKETVNGVATRHYVFDESSPGAMLGIYEKIKGNVWVAQDGGYVVKYNFTAEDAEDSYSWSWEIYDINAGFTIEPPADAQGVREDIPLMPDASETFWLGGMITYQTASDWNAVTEFYQAEMPANGWTYDQSGIILTEQSAMLNFSKDGISTAITVSLESSRGTTVIILVDE